MKLNYFLTIVVIILAGAGLWLLNSTDQNNWKTFIDPQTEASFQYPETIGLEYIAGFDWPPQIQILDSDYTCTEAGSPEKRAGETKELIIASRTFCVTEIIEGAAGSIYTQYAYAFEIDNKTAILTFSTRMSQCGNYSESEKTLCEKERDKYEREAVIDRLIAKIAGTLKLK